MNDERNQLPLGMETEMTTEMTSSEAMAAGVKAAHDIFSPPAFNIDRWKQETLDGLHAMESERDTLKAEAQRIAERVATLDRDIEALRMVTSTFENGEDDSRRDSMVKVTLESVARESMKDWMVFDGVAALLRERKPGVKESSIRSAISRLLRDGVLIQDPPVGDVPKGSRVERRWKVCPEYLAYQEASKAEADSQDGTSAKDIVARIHRLLKSKPEGLTGKDLAWLAADLHVEVEEISAAINTQMAEGLMETAMKDGVDILRAKAPPGSKEELKRTKIEDRPLFPDMDRPDHA